MVRGFCLLGLLVLAGCQQPQTYNNATVIPSAPNAAPILPSYCYKTLSSVDCYAQEVVGWEGRLVSYQGPPPSRFGWSGAGTGNR